MQIIKDFITLDEQQEFINWYDARDIPLLKPRRVQATSSTATYSNSVWIHKDGPPIYYDIQSRIKDKFNLTEPAEGRQGKIFIHNLGCETPEHRDYKNTARITLMIQNAEAGGKLVHDGNIAEIPVRGIAYYDANVPHAVSPVISGKRIVFIFEFD